MPDILYLSGSNRTVKWVDEPDTRGTFNLLSICLITLFLCVWTSIHLNLPGSDQRFWPKFLRRLKWIIGALLAPEILIATAGKQYQIAKRLQQEALKILKVDKKDPVALPKPAGASKTS